MPCVFERTFMSDRSFVITPAVTPGCEWVLAEEGVPTAKLDGTACAVIGGKLFKRYDAKRGKPAPPNGIPCDDPDPVTGHWPHWIPVGHEPESRWHREAWECCNLDPDNSMSEVDGTYELCGPKLQSNPHRLDRHMFFLHTSCRIDRRYLPDVLTFDSIRDAVSRAQLHVLFDGDEPDARTLDAEGIVFHHPDGRMAKIRRADFGFPWPVPA